MATSDESPAIAHISWGKLEVAGHGVFKDAKLYPGGARAWDWGETGTRHEPGIQPADVQELLDHGAEVIVLSRGMHKRLQTCPETLDLLQGQGVAVHVLETEEAVAKYEALRGTTRVGALIHSTC
jgi:hypothetical protein